MRMITESQARQQYTGITTNGVERGTFSVAAPTVSHDFRDGEYDFDCFVRHTGNGTQDVRSVSSLSVKATESDIRGHSVVLYDALLTRNLKHNGWIIIIYERTGSAGTRSRNKSDVYYTTNPESLNPTLLAQIETQMTFVLDQVAGGAPEPIGKNPFPAVRR